MTISCFKKTYRAGGKQQEIGQQCVAVVRVGVARVRVVTFQDG